jgi:predicted DNA-binding protein (UPF0251 family)
MTVDTAELRKTHVDGWRPRQSVSIDVETLRALLDELDALRALDRQLGELQRAAERLMFRNRELQAAIARLGAKLDEEEAL